MCSVLLWFLEFCCSVMWSSCGPQALHVCFVSWAEPCLTLWTCCNLGAMATKVRRHDSRVHPYQRIVTTDRGQLDKILLPFFKKNYLFISEWGIIHVYTLRIFTVEMCLHMKCLWKHSGLQKFMTVTELNAIFSQLYISVHFLTTFRSKTIDCIFCCCCIFF